MESLNSSSNMTQYYTYFETEIIPCNMAILNDYKLNENFKVSYSNLFVNDKNNTLSVFLNPYDARNKTYKELMNDSDDFERVTFNVHGDMIIHNPFKDSIESFICNGQTYLLIKVNDIVCVICLETLEHCTLRALSHTRYEIVDEQYASFYRSYQSEYYTNYDEHKSLCDIPAVIPGQYTRYGVHQIGMDYMSASYSITDEVNKNNFIAVDFVKGYSVKITKKVLTTAMASTEPDILCPSTDLEITKWN